MELSKSTYCRCLPCPKIPWLDTHKPEAAVDTAPDSALRNGLRVGELARSYFGDYRQVEPQPDKRAMAQQTAVWMADEVDNIAEASFETDGLFCAVDLLHRTGGGWDIIEVKSSTHVTDAYVEDAAFQYYVLTKCGVRVTGVYILHINSSYVFHDALDLLGLFKPVDCTELCRDKQPAVEENLRAIRAAAAAAEEPAADLSTACEAPYPCPYTAYCRRGIPSPSVFDIRGLRADKKYELYRAGIVSFEDVTVRKPKLSAAQLRQVETAFYHLPDTIDREALRSFLGTLTYPIYHLDFESFQLAIPQWEGCRPYEQIPFQYSLHIEQRDGALEHREFLAPAGADPRRALAEQLCRDIPPDVCALAYNMRFEKSVIKGLADLFPELAEHLMAIRENMRDLMVPFQKQAWYSEAMQGSFSIKYVLPALCPGDPALDYHNLSMVHNGAEASDAFASMAYLPSEEAEALRANLLKYCGLDTFAMVKVLGRLREAV